MPTLSRPPDEGRAFIPVEVSIDEPLRLVHSAAGIHLPAPVMTIALIDTGAGVTCIDPHIRHALGLAPAGSLAVAIPFGPSEGQSCETFRVSLVIRHPDGNSANDQVKLLWSVAETPIAHTGAEVLIGTDLLQGSRFVYDGVASTFTWEY